MTTKQKFGHWLLKITGWKLIGNAPEVSNFIFTIFPHTSYADFLVGKMVNLRLGFPINFLIKKEAFFFPLGLILKSLGGIPVDRKKPEKTKKYIIERFQDSKPFVLVIAPEGTRKKVKKWKHGFWFFATKAKVSVVPVGINYKTKTVNISESIFMTDNQQNDFEIIKTVYKSMDLHALHPNKSELII